MLPRTGGRLGLLLLTTGSVTGISLTRWRHCTLQAASAQGEVVLVTGGAGFLGQHVVQLLHQRAPGVKEIRVLDSSPFVKSLDYDAVKPMKIFRGDVTKIDDVRRAVEGADVVIHTVGVIDVSRYPDEKKMTLVNVEGTRNVIRASNEAKVKRLIHTSTCDVLVGRGDVIDADENTPIPEKPLFPGYSNSKRHAEDLVLKAHTTSQGSLRTVALRTGGMYGEGDRLLVRGALQGAQRAGGKFYPMSCPTRALIQSTYVGNFAWAHVLAAKTLANDVTVGGQPYVITDDTPATDVKTFLVPFIEGRGFEMSSRAIPFPLLFAAVKMAELVSGVVKPFYELKLRTSTAALVYLRHSHTYSRKRAEDRLGYRPLFTYEEALERSLKYYKQCPLSDNT